MTKGLTLKMTGPVVMAGASKPAYMTSLENPYLQGGDSWIAIAGMVASVSAHRFVIFFGSDSIVVEMDTSNYDPEYSVLIENDEVTLSGIVHDNNFDNAAVKAVSVYVDKLGTRFYGRSASADKFVDSFVSYPPITAGEVNIHGRVTGVNDGCLHLDTGNKSLIIEMEANVASFHPETASMPFRGVAK